MNKKLWQVEITRTVKKVVKTGESVVVHVEADTQDEAMDAALELIGNDENEDGDPLDWTDDGEIDSNEEVIGEPMVQSLAECDPSEDD